MTQKKESFMWRTLLLTGAFLIILSACGGGGGNGGGIPDPDPEPAPAPTPDPTPDPAPDPTPEVTTGEVTFMPDWGSFSNPTALRFYLYPATGAVISKDGDVSGCKLTLENGTYKILAYNADATGVTYENTDSYDKAVVRVAAAKTPTRASSFIGQPDKVYVLTMNGLTVEKGSNITPKVSIRNLVKSVALRFTIDNAAVIRSIQGRLNGFLSSVSLTTGLPENAPTVASQTGMLFDVTLSGDTGSAALGCLGMLDPKNGNAYSSVLQLSLTLAGGRTTSVEVDLSKVISDILTKNDGALPDGTPASVNIKIESQADMVFAASITDWSVGETLDGDIR